MRTSVKSIIEDNYTWTITRVLQGSNGKVRIDAQKRFYDRSEGAVNFFSKWVSYSYANKIYREERGKDLEINF